MNTYFSLALLASVAVANTPEVVIAVNPAPVVADSSVSITVTKEEPSVAQEVAEDIKEVGGQIKDVAVDAAHATADTAIAAKDFAVDAAIATKDAVVNALETTVEATQEVAANVAASEPVQELKEAAHDLGSAAKHVGHSIKSGAIKAYDATVHGAKVATDAVIVKPARAIANSEFVAATSQVVHDITDSVKLTTSHVVNSDLVQGTVEGASEVGSQLAETPEEVYVVLLETPVNAIQDAASAVAHSKAVEKAQEIANATYKTVVVVPATYAKDTVVTIAHSEGGQDVKELALQIGDAPVALYEEARDASKAVVNKISAIVSSIF